jgi:glycosyltransferase involved in cell wall biosynthesis
LLTRKRFKGWVELRLAVVSPFLDRRHGTELCIIEQIERFASQEHWKIDLYSQEVSQVNGVCPASETSRDSAESILWHKVSGIPGPHLLKYIWWFFSNQWQRWRDRRSGRVRPDLVYSPGINCLDADVIVVHIVFRAFYERVRRELSLRRVPIRGWLRVIHRRLYYKLIMLLERRIYRDPKVRLVAVSSLVAAQLREHFQREGVTVIPNAVDTLRFTPEARMAKRNASRESALYDESDFVLLLIGNDWKKKGLDTLLKALAELMDVPWRLLVAGSDDPDLYRTLLRQLAATDRVRFEKSSADVLSFYGAADLYAGPSLEDAFNLPILEAMACGLPVIASAEAGASEMIRDGETGLILSDPQDHLRLARLIRRIYSDQALRLAIGEAASRYVLENCSWDRNAFRTRGVLEAVRVRSRGI